MNGKFGSRNVLSVQGNLEQDYKNTFKGEGKIMYRTENYGSNQGSVRFNKEGSIEDFSFSGNANLNNQNMAVKANLKLSDINTGSLNIQTPFKGLSNVGMSFKHSGNMNNFETNLEATYPAGNTYSGKMTFYKYVWNRIQTTIEVKTPISGYEFNKVEYRHEGNGDSLECYATAEYGYSKKIEYEMKAAKSPSLSFSVSLKTPFPKYEEMGIAASMMNNLPKLSTVEGKVNAGNGNVMTLNGRLDISKDYYGNLEVKTPIRSYENMMISGALVNNLPAASSVNAKINAGNDNVMSLKGALDISRDYIGSLDLSTPIDGFKNIGLSFKHAGSAQLFASEGKVIYKDNKQISGSISFKNSGADILAKLETPFNGFEMTQFSFDGTNFRRKTTAETKLTYGNNQVIKANLKIGYIPNYEMVFDAASPIALGKKKVALTTGLDLSNKIVCFASLETPVAGYTDLKLKFQHSMNNQKLFTDLKMNYADGQEISGMI